VTPEKGLDPFGTPHGCTVQPCGIFWTEEDRAPDLFYIECANILWKYVRRLGLSQADARLFVEQLGQLALIAAPAAALIDDALDIALTHAITAYAAAYVALAGQLDLPLITADARLARALAGSAYDVRWLGDLN
jgi:predicted nucleic acid-binding protein